MTAKTIAERQAAYRQKQRAAGLAEVRGIYAPKSAHEKIKRYAKKTCVPRNGKR